MQHLDEGTIHSWLDGALSADEAARVEAHVKDCAQCQAAVAEARGFIAASSRILTALDNAPRGVIPAAAPRKRIDPIVWRAAATVLVVAVGTLAVLKSTGYKVRPSANSEAVFTSERANDTAMPGTVLADQGAETTPTLEKSAATSKAPNGSSSGGVINQAPARPPAATTPSAGEPVRRDAADAAAIKKNPAMPGGRGLGSEGSAAAPVPSVAPPAAAMAPQQFGAVIGGRVAGVAAMENARENWRIREIGPRRALGEKQTLYEVAPSDTVVFAEELNAQLESVVVTGAGVTQTPALRGRSTAKVSAAAADTPRTAAASAPAAAPSTARSFPSFTEAANGVNTLTWKDSTTGTVLKLSGRHTRAELEEIRRRIERARAAADSLKRAP